MVTAKRKLLRLILGLTLILIGGAVWVRFDPRAQLGAAEQEPASGLAAPSEQNGSKLKELLKERLAVVREVLVEVTKQYGVGSVSFESIRQASRAVLDAEIDLCETDKERTTVLEKMVALAKQNETMAEQRFKKGQTRRCDVLMATAGRLETEIALERVKSQAPARPN